MPINSTTIKSKSFRLFTLLFLLLAAFGVLVADSLTKQRDASGTITLELCKKGAGGQWEVVDRVKSPVNFTASIAEITSGKEITSNFNWRGASEKGRIAQGRMLGAGKVKFDVLRGVLELELPMEATLDGKKIPLNVKLTTESISSPTGQISGKKAELNGKTPTGGIVGFNVIKARDLANEPIAAVGQKNPGKKEGGRTTGVVGGSAGLTEDLIVVMRGEGRVVAR